MIKDNLNNLITMFFRISSLNRRQEKTGISLRILFWSQEVSFIDSQEMDWEKSKNPSLKIWSSHLTTSKIKTTCFSKPKK